MPRKNHVTPTVYYATNPAPSCAGRPFMLVCGRGEQRLTLQEAQSLARDLFGALDAEYRATHPPAVTGGEGVGLFG